MYLLGDYDFVVTHFRVAEELGNQMTQNELAQRAGIHFVTVNRLCKNTTKQVSLETLDRISKVLGCKPGDLLERKPERRRLKKR